MAQDLAKRAADDGIRYFLIGFVDLFGVLRAKLVPAAAIGQMQKAGAAFAGFATHLDLTPADPDMFAIPDPASLMILPWKPEIAWVAADLHLGGARRRRGMFSNARSPPPRRTAIASGPGSRLSSSCSSPMRPGLPMAATGR